MQAKQITPTTWILTSSQNNKKLGLVNLKESSYTLMQAPGKKFNSLEEIAEHFGEKLKEGNFVEEEQITEVCGYPVKHKKVFDVASDEESNLHTYKTTPNGKSIFVAGYFCIKFKKGAVSSFCPKVETLLENEYLGPFKNKFDMQFQLTRLNREK